MKLSEIKVSYNLPNSVREKISNSKDLYNLAIHQWDINTIEMQEEMKVILLNRNNQVIGIYELSRGGLSGTLVDIKLLMSVALKCLASGIALAHNHPSGNLSPSQPDYSITNKIKTACSYFEISLLDHIIVTKYGYFSFADEGKL